MPREATMQLSAEQKRFFDTFGYLVIRRLFDGRETAAITAGFEQTMRMCGLDRVGDGARRCMLGPIHHVPELQSLLEHPGVVGLAEGVFGGEFNYALGDGNFYSGDTHWHPDGGWGQLFAAKIVVYLDPLTRATGALRVIPGSHDPRHPLRRDRDGQASGVAGLLEECGIHGRDLPGAEAVETEPGDVIIFNHDLFHASFGGTKRRRMFTMNLTRRCHTPEDFALLRRYLGTHSPGGHKIPIGAMTFHPLWDGAGPERRRRLEQCRAVHDEIFPRPARQLSHSEQIEAMMRAMNPEAAAALAR
jgi:hypothetical protein